MVNVYFATARLVQNGMSMHTMNATLPEVHSRIGATRLSIQVIPKRDLAH